MNCSYQSIAKSGVNYSIRILPGRPKGGVAILYRRSMSRVVLQLLVDFTRACAVLVKAAGHNDNYYIDMCI